MTAPSIPDPTSPLDSLAYTAHRMQHATPEHLNITTRRCFIGPIPEGWLRNHRRDWYKQHLHIHYSSKSATFSANSNVGRHRRLTGLDGPSATATHRQNFPQPNLPPNQAAEQQEGEVPGTDDEDENQSELALAEPTSLLTTALTHASNVIQAQNKDSSISNPQAAHPSSPTAVDSRQKKRGYSARPQKTRAASTASFVTAHESPDEQPQEALDKIEEACSSRSSTQDGQPRLQGRSEAGLTSIRSKASPLLGHETSTASLLRHDGVNEQDSGAMLPSPAIKTTATDSNLSTSKQNSLLGTSDSPGTVRFAIPEAQTQKRQHIKARIAQMSKRKSFKNIRDNKLHDGEIIKLENMLVRVEFTLHEVPSEFDENDSQKIESRTMETWKEFMVVCRESSDENVPYVLQMYKTRVIPAIERTHIRKSAAHSIDLKSSDCKINLYSSLDKTMVIWTPHRKGSMMYIMQAKSGASSMEWYTFLRNVLGQDRTSLIQVNVPDLEVHLRLENPFATIESIQDLAEAAGGDEAAFLKTMKNEQAVAANIMKRCMEMLDKCNEWQAVIKNWELHERIGLAWKRYDRLEWIHGANEMKMYGTIGMEKTHELELRPKQHYPTTTHCTREQTVTEPVPVEGFLVRLTSQRGIDQKLGKLFFKRLYFSTHDQFLVFNRPGKADPPSPPKMPGADDTTVPSAREIADKIPIVYSVNPFPVQDGHLAWMSDGCPATQEIAQHDLFAYQENERKIGLLLNCDGVVNLCNIETIRNVRRGAVPVDENLGEGGAVDFDLQVNDNNVEDDGTTGQFDDNRTFELVLRNGLIIRLQAFNKSTKIEWQDRLQALVGYWKLRVRADLLLYKSVRQQNLSRLNIDEETEAYMGQFARKWEVTNSYASSELYNVCGISSCRSIHISGTLYRRAHMHGSFQRNLVMLSNGQLLIFQDALRSRTGQLLKHIHHDRVTSIDLRDCYIYSGLITEHDLLYTSTGFDIAHPGRHALPRMYADDGWSSIDENTMTCFVIWHGKRSSWFRTQDRERDHAGTPHNTLKKVTRLGAEGKSVLFKTRSRAERDRWVTAIGMEIERLAEKGDEVRIVGDAQK